MDLNCLIQWCMFYFLQNIFLANGEDLDLSNSLIWGPGLRPDIIITPARYFFIEAIDSTNKRQNVSPQSFNVVITGESEFGSCRIWVNKLDRKDGSFIIRYKLYYPCYNLRIEVKHNSKHIANSPYIIKGIVYNEECNCSQKNVEQFLQDYECKMPYKQIVSDLVPFNNVDMVEVRKVMLKKFNSPRSYSICNYVIKDNEIYRKCYGQHVGFKMFVDAILLSLTRKVKLADTEFWTNLGDWPLIKRSAESPVPVFSWCGSEETYDIAMPTYDLTEATLENMGRVMLDMLSVQGNIEKTWDDKIGQVFFRGRDSRRERLDLIDISRKKPDLFNVSITNYFFFTDQEKKYGKSPHVSFFKFFDYKYQINIDGTVASYRFPYLLVGDSVVLKQDSSYYEHFYGLLEAGKHYIPVKRDLSNLIETIEWAIDNDDEVQNISKHGQKFARENLMPTDIFCYHMALHDEWSKRISSEIIVVEGMEHVSQPPPDKHYGECKCMNKLNDEL